MSAADQIPNSHSAVVHMQLTVNGHVLPIAQLGPDFLILKDPIQHSPADGEIAVWVDGHERRWTVRLPQGIQPGRRQTSIARPAGNGAAAR